MRDVTVQEFRLNFSGTRRDGVVDMVRGREPGFPSRRGGREGSVR
jgi:hypothetical protein